MNDGSAFWIIVAFAAFVYWMTGDGREEITSYSARCDNGATVAPVVYADGLGMTYEQLRASIKRCAMFTASKTTFSLSTANDSVTYRIGDLPYLNKQVDCAILDRENWVCDYSDGSGKIGFIDGLRSLPANEVEYGYFYQKRWQYLATKVINLVAGPTSLPWLIPDQVPSY
jgi:hypothetical protein